MLNEQMLNQVQHDKAVLEIYNVLGEKIFSRTETENPQSEIDLSNHAPGIYFVKVQTPEKIFTQKLVVQ